MSGNDEKFNTRRLLCPRCGANPTTIHVTYNGNYLWVDCVLRRYIPTGKVCYRAQVTIEGGLPSEITSIGCIYCHDNEARYNQTIFEKDVYLLSHTDLIIDVRAKFVRVEVI